MREILFRGKRKDNGEWTEGLYGINTICCEQSTYLSAVISKMPQGIYDYESWEVELETVGQYTGLTDKNGVKIFEGDIVKGTAYSATTIGVIVWIDEISSFGVRRVNAPNPTAWENSSILRCVSLGKTDEFAAEVIGNIYDNPELLNAAANGRR